MEGRRDRKKRLKGGSNEGSKKKRNKEGSKKVKKGR